MNWFEIAIIGPILWSIDSHIDKYILAKYYKNVRPATTMFLSALVNGLFTICIFVLYPKSLHLPLGSEIIILFAGSLYFFAAFPYFYALKRDEASRIVPLFQAQPVFAYILAAIFLAEYLTPIQIVAGVLIILGALMISIDLKKFKLKNYSFWLMMLSSALFATGAFLFKYVGTKSGFWPTAYYQYMGTALAGAIFFIVAKRFRRDLMKVLRENGRKVVTFSLITETLNTAARICTNYASLLAPLALVILVNGLQPAFVFLIGIALTLFIPRIERESMTSVNLIQKSLSIAVIFFGTYLLLIN